MRSSALVFVSMLSIVATTGAARAGGRRCEEDRQGGGRLDLAGHASAAAWPKVRKARLRSRARARLRLIDSLYQDGLGKTVRAHQSSSRSHESRARAIENDPGAQVLFGQTLLDARGEHDYWQRMGS